VSDSKKVVVAAVEISCSYVTRLKIEYIGKWGRRRRGRQLSDDLKIRESCSFGTDHRVDCEIRMKHNSSVNRNPILR